MLFSDINWVAVVLCVPVWLAINGVWHSTLVMNGPAQQLAGENEHKLGRAQWGLIPVALAASLAIAIVLKWYQQAGGAQGWQAGIAVGGLIWAGVIVPIRVFDTIHRPRRVELFLLEILNLLLIFTASGGLIGYWQVR